MSLSSITSTKIPKGTVLYFYNKYLDWDMLPFTVSPNENQQLTLTIKYQVVNKDLTPLDNNTYTEIWFFTPYTNPFYQMLFVYRSSSGGAVTGSNRLQSTGDGRAIYIQLLDDFTIPAGYSTFFSDYVTSEGQKGVFIYTKDAPVFLEVLKEVRGGLSGDTAFDFEIWLGELYENFTLKDGERKTFECDRGTYYRITEKKTEGYSSTEYTKTGTVNQAGTTTVLFINNKEDTPQPPEPPTPPPPHEYIDTSVSGIGEKSTRINEITPDNVAIFRNFVLGYNADIRDIGGVMDIEGHNFNAEITSPTTVQITDGTCFAYGYIGHCAGREITFFPPAVEQYQIIYAEIDRSVIPNTISIKTKNNQNSSQVLLNTFRQDVLSTIKTGKFQVPLWFVKLSNKGIEELETLRPLRGYIDHVVYSDNTSRISGTIAASAEVEGDMKPLDTNDKTVATTQWVQAIVEQEIRR